MSKIIISRPHSFYGSVRSAKVFINDLQIDTIKDNEQKIYEVSPGTHRVKVGYGALSGISNTLEINIRENEEILLSLKAHTGLYYFLNAIGALSGLAIYFGFVTKNYGLILLALIIVIPIQIIQTKKVLTLEYNPK